MTGFRYRGIWYTIYHGIPLPTGRTVAQQYLEYTGSSMSGINWEWRD